MKEIITKGLSAGSLFKILWIGLTIPLSIFGVIAGIFAYFGSNIVMLNDQYVYGLQGLITGIVSGFLSPFFLAIFLWIIILFGIWIWTRFKPIILKYKE